MHKKLQVLSRATSRFEFTGNMFRVLSIPWLVINRRQFDIKKKSLGVSFVWPIHSREGLAIVVEKLLLLIEQRSLSSDKNFEDSECCYSTFKNARGTLEKILTHTDSVIK